MKALLPTPTFIQLFVCLLFTQIGLAQYTIPEKPEMQTSVYDYAKVLSETEKAQLEEKLVRYSDSTSTQTKTQGFLGKVIPPRFSRTLR